MNRINIAGNMWLVKTQAGFRTAAKMTANDMGIDWRTISTYPTKYPAIVAFSKFYMGSEILNVECASVDTLLDKMYSSNITTKSHYDILSIKSKEALFAKQKEDLREPNYRVHVLSEEEDGSIAPNTLPDQLLTQPVGCIFENGGDQITFTYNSTTVRLYLEKLLKDTTDYQTIVCAKYDQYNDSLMKVWEMKHIYLMDYSTDKDFIAVKDHRRYENLVTAIYTPAVYVTELDIADPATIDKLKNVYKLTLFWNPNK